MKNGPARTKEYTLKSHSGYPGWTLSQFVKSSLLRKINRIHCPEIIGFPIESVIKYFKEIRKNVRLAMFSSKDSPRIMLLIS